MSRADGLPSWASIVAMVGFGLLGLATTGYRALTYARSSWRRA